TMPEEVVKTAATLGIELDRHRFVQTGSFKPAATSRKGVYACGAFTGPKDIPTSVMEASASACAATESLAAARHSETKEIHPPPERNVGREPPRIGVFVCNCGVNIGGVVRVPEVVAYARNLPHVVHVEDNLFSCSQDTQDRMKEIIRDKGLNRVVVAACTPRTHEPLFQETLVNAGLNKYLFEMANIRNHDSWVHSHDPGAATEKAKDLVRMAVVKSALLSPLHESELPVTPSALVVGGGIAGMTAALSLARHGYPVHLIEKSDSLGGNALRLHKTYRGERVSTFLEELTGEVSAEKRIVLHLGATVSGVQGFVGNFKTEIQNGGPVETIAHGVTIIATGAKEHRPTEYLYGKHPAVVTQLEMDGLMKDHDLRLAKARNVAFIQCVGSRDDGHPYCSKVCCTHTVRAALELKEMNPDTGVHVLYRDMRTYGTREELYREAKSRGVLFFSYSTGRKPVAVPRGEQVRLLFREEILDRDVALDVDLLCLATAIEPYRDHGLDKLFKIPTDADGWFLEAHQKLRPVDFATDGIFLCG
ncbi:MAG: FAD-dependent oxidoreductase, partial [Syntrophobacteraceae bacterium]|nr:FAD-dependent oxidoreductase [Syntrophobacteraceae bacterium]